MCNFEEDDEFEIQGALQGKFRPLIAPGHYQMVLVGYKTGLYFSKVPKVTLSFTIVDQGDALGVTVERHYRVSSIKGRPGKHGAFKVGPGSDFAREYTAVMSPTRRLDRFNLKAMKNKVLVGHVVTVTTSSRQKELVPALQYSTVRELVRQAP